jgi:hypothetical protein
MPYGYVDPLQQVRQQQAWRRLVQPQSPGPAPFPPAAPQTQGGPLAGFEESYRQVMLGAKPQCPRPYSVAADMAEGAAAGFAAWLVWRAMKRRKKGVGEYTTPFFRFLAIWWAFMLAGSGLSMVWPIESMKFLGTAFVLGTLLSLVYLIYRVTGHGRYNTRRRGAHRGR